MFLKTIYIVLFCFSFIAAQDGQKTFSYNDFKNPKFCGSSCHTEFYQQWKQAMMSQAYTHEWDEIEYFKLAVPHAEKEPMVAGVKAGCNGCHTPMALLSNDVPPPVPSMNSRANESVSCDVCHSITGFTGDTPFNFNYVMDPGKTKYSGRETESKSPAHELQKNEFYKTAEFCGTCHNEKSPYGAWVKATHLEWKDGPYSKEGVRCQDCHMTKSEMKTAAMGEKYPDAKLHLFHGAHDPGKVRGVIELRINPDIKEVEPGEKVKFTVHLFNQKTGHKFPTGSVEDRIVWMHVEAVDEKGNIYHIPVDKKGIPGEEYLIGSDALAYQDMGVPLNDSNFKGVQRDGIPIGDRIFRMAYLDPNGKMTMQQWHTASFGTDYRIGPRETKTETLTFVVPDKVAPGKLKVTAVLNYQLLVKPVGDFLGVPESETQIVKVNEHSTEITVLP